VRQMIGPQFRGTGSQTALFPGLQNLHFKHDGCELCILEWLVKHSFFTAVPVCLCNVRSFCPNGNELACEPVQHTLLQYETVVN